MRKEKTPKANGRRRTLYVDEWPEADRLAWQEACRPSHRLKRGGAASHLAPVSQEAYALRYGLFLGFLRLQGRVDSNAAPAGLVNPSNIDAYLTDLNVRVSSVTAYNSIRMLRRAAELLDPSQDFSWIVEIENDLALVMEPRSKFGRFVLPDRIVEAGLTLIVEAKKFATTDLEYARRVRNGLMIALLALCPSRIKNYAALEIGKTFRLIGEQWWITVPAKDTKTRRRPEERPIPLWLNPFIEIYLQRARPLLVKPGKATNALWVSSLTGRAMETRKLWRLITQTTLETLGIGILPHLFRTADATAAAAYCNEMPYLASALLGHSDPSVTEEHYNRASSIGAAQTFAEIIRDHYR